MPAAAVIPAPVAYIRVVVVKRLVVRFLLGFAGPPLGRVSGAVLALFSKVQLHLTVWCRVEDIYFEEMRVFKASECCEYRSME